MDWVKKTWELRDTLNILATDEKLVGLVPIGYWRNITF